MNLTYLPYLKISVEHSKMIEAKLLVRGKAYLRQSNLSKNLIAFSAFDDKSMADSKTGVALFTIKRKHNINIVL